MYSVRVFYLAALASLAFAFAPNASFPQSSKGMYECGYLRQSHEEEFVRELRHWRARLDSPDFSDVNLDNVEKALRAKFNSLVSESKRYGCEPIDFESLV